MLGVSTDRADLHQLLDAAAASLLDQVQPHGHVCVEEAPRLLFIGPDPADLGCEMNDDIRSSFVEQPPDGVRPGQIIFTRPRHKDIRHAAFIQ